MDRRAGGGGGAFDVEVVAEGLGGGSNPPCPDCRDELLLVKDDLLGGCWSFRRASGSAGAVRLLLSGTVGFANRSLVGLCSIGGDVMLAVAELVLCDAGNVRELIKVSNFAMGPVSGVASLSGFPCRLLGGGGGLLTEELGPAVARGSLASLVSSSSEVRGLSSCVGGIVSKSEYCEIEAESALELLSLTGWIVAVWAFCVTDTREAALCRSPVSNILLNASTSMVDFTRPPWSFAPAANSCVVDGFRRPLANLPNVSVTASSLETCTVAVVSTTIAVLAFAFSCAFSIALSSSSSGCSANGSVANAWL